MCKKELQSAISDVLGEKWDFPDTTGKGGTSTTGNTARRILYHGGREVVIASFPERFQNSTRKIGQYLSVVLRLFSSDKKIDVNEYREICTNLYLMYLECFPTQKNSSKPIENTWIRISPSLHKLLAHSWELIDRNDDKGLKCFDESGLEANNKVLRSIRLNLSRKTSQTENLEDVINRLWLGSDPVVNNIRLQARPFCKHCKEYGHSTRYCRKANPVLGPLSNDDALFEKLCI